MKKLIALLLLLGCAVALVACNKNKGCDHADVNGDGLCDVCGDNMFGALGSVYTMYENSVPTKSVIETGINMGGRVYAGHYEMVSGRVDGKKVTVYDFAYDNIAQVNDEADAGIKQQTGKWIYIEGVGLCEKANVANRVWNKDGKDPAEGSIALSILNSKITDYSYENHTLTATIPANAVYEILGIDLYVDEERIADGSSAEIPATVVIRDDGASVTGVTVTYTLPAQTVSAGGSATATVTDIVIPAQSVTITATYSYDLEKVSID